MSDLFRQEVVGRSPLRRPPEFLPKRHYRAAGEQREEREVNGGGVIPAANVGRARELHVRLYPDFEAHLLPVLVL